jgi:hypothetical protein
MDPVSHAQALLTELAISLEGVTADKLQFQTLWLQAKHYIFLVNRKPAEMKVAYVKNGFFVFLFEALRSAAALFCDFQGRSTVDDLMMHTSDFEKLEELFGRFAHVITKTGLADLIALYAWKEARAADKKTWGNALEACFTECRVNLDLVAQMTLGSGASARDLSIESKALAERLIEQRLRNVEKTPEADVDEDCCCCCRRPGSVEDRSGPSQVAHDDKRFGRFSSILVRHGLIRCSSPWCVFLSKNSCSVTHILESKCVYCGQKFAVKKVDFRAPSDEAFFLEGITAMAKLRHPNIGLVLNYVGWCKQPKKFHDESLVSQLHS